MKDIDGKSFISHACTTILFALLTFLCVSLVGCEEKDDDYIYLQRKYFLLINNHSSSPIVLMEVTFGRTNGYSTEVHHLDIPPGTMAYEIQVAERTWTSSVTSEGTTPVSMEIQDAAGHTETFTYEWWEADEQISGKIRTMRLIIDFQG